MAALAGQTIPDFVSDTLAAFVAKQGSGIDGGDVGHDPAVRDPGVDSDNDEDDEEPDLTDDIRLPLPCSGPAEHDPLDDL